MVGIVVYTGRDYGEMLDAEHRSRTTGAVNREGTAAPEGRGRSGCTDWRPSDASNLFAPVVVLIAVTLGRAFWTGYQSWLSSQAEAGAPTAFGAAANDAGLTQVLIDIVGAGNFATALIWGSFAMVVTAIAIGLAYGLFDIGDGVDTVIDGFGIMLTAVTILVLAWTISSVAETLGTGEFVRASPNRTSRRSCSPFSSCSSPRSSRSPWGSSWATMGLVTPIAIRVAYEFGTGFELVPVAVGAVFSGAIFGDHASPISDTTVLSATFSGADLIDHVRTQLPYALTVFGVVVGCYLLNGYLGVPPIVFLLSASSPSSDSSSASRDSTPTGRGSSRSRRVRPPTSPNETPRSTPIRLSGPADRRLRQFLERAGVRSRMDGTLDHTMIRVADLEESLEWYQTHLEYEEKDRFEGDGFTIVYLGPETMHEDGAMLEITHNEGEEPEVGDAWGHIAVRVPEGNSKRTTSN